MLSDLLFIFLLIISYYFFFFFFLLFEFWNWTFKTLSLYQEHKKRKLSSIVLDTINILLYYIINLIHVAVDHLGLSGFILILKKTPKSVRVADTYYKIKNLIKYIFQNVWQVLFASLLIPLTPQCKTLQNRQPLLTSMKPSTKHILYNVQS